MVLDGVVSSAEEVLGDDSPAVAESLVADPENPLLVFAPGGLVDIGAEVVEPAFSALFADSAREESGDVRPLFRPQFLYQFDDLLVLLFGPRAFH